MSRQDLILEHFELYKSVYGFYPHGFEYDGLTDEEIRNLLTDLLETECV